MLTISTAFTSLVAFHAFLASINLGQVDASIFPRNNGGHTARRSLVIRGLLDVAGHGDGFDKRQNNGCDPGFFVCPNNISCCPSGQTCGSLSDGTPTCCCSEGGNCPKGQLACSANVNVCCPTGDVCSADGGCFPAGSGGGGGGSGGSSSSLGGSGGTGGLGGGTGSLKGTTSSLGGGTGGLGGGTGGLGGSTGGFGTTTSLLGPTDTITALSTSSPTLGGGLGGTTSPFGLTTPVATVTTTPGATPRSGEAGLRAGVAVIVMSSIIVAGSLTMLVF